MISRFRLQFRFQVGRSLKSGGANMCEGSGDKKHLSLVI
jgi:hypothetical protein